MLEGKAVKRFSRGIVEADKKNDGVENPGIRRVVFMYLSEKGGGKRERKERGGKIAKEGDPLSRRKSREEKEENLSNRCGIMKGARSATSFEAGLCRLRR